MQAAKVARPQNNYSNFNMLIKNSGGAPSAGPLFWDNCERVLPYRVWQEGRQNNAKAVYGLRKSSPWARDERNFGRKFVRLADTVSATGIGETALRMTLSQSHDRDWRKFSPLRQSSLGKIA
jgi:hypothetical protein